MRTRTGWALLGLAIAIIGRLPALLYHAAIDDEAVYSVVGAVMVNGGLPYRDAIERKPPLLFWLYSGIFKLFGVYNWTALHLVALVWVLLSMVALYVAGRRLLDPAAGWIAAAMYAVFQPWATWKDLAFNGEVVMNLPLVVAFAVAFSAQRRRAVPAMYLCGALVAVASLLKQPAAIAALPLAVYPWLSAYRRARGVSVNAAALQTVALGLGGITVVGIVGAYLWARGILADAVYWSIYDHRVLVILWDRAIEHTALFVAIALPLVLPLVLWRQLRRAWAARSAEFVVLIIWLAASAIGTAAGGRFYPHYYIQLLPPLALLAGVFYRAWMADASPLLRPSVIGGWCLLALIGGTVVDARGLFQPRGLEGAAAYLRAHSTRGDRLFVWGQATQLYADCQRLPASRYIASFPLTGYIFGAHVPAEVTSANVKADAWPNLQSDVASHPPRFIVDTEVGSAADFPIGRFPILDELVHSHYHVAARFDDSVIYERNDPER